MKLKDGNISSGSSESGQSDEEPVKKSVENLNRIEEQDRKLETERMTNEPSVILLKAAKTESNPDFSSDTQFTGSRGQNNDIFGPPTNKNLI